MQYTKTWDVAKAVLRGKFAAINVYVKKQEGSQTTQLYALRKRKKN